MKQVMDTPKIDKLQKFLEPIQPYAIAYSGGNDSTFLAAISRYLGMDFCCIHCISEFTIASETQRARSFAMKMGIRYFEIEISVMGIKEIVTNNEDRCYYCKKAIFKKIQECARLNSFKKVVEAGNVSDVNDFRPGRKACEELSIYSPLIDAGIDKTDIISGLQQLNIPYLKTSNSCLATRIPYKTIITHDILGVIQKAEDFIVSLGFEGVRVRYHYPIARIEVLQDEIQRIIDPEIRHKIIAFCKKLGFLYVTIDLEGFKSGNLNRMLHHE
ncbi:MAG: ATP-dependent sacrificial sulfur transferase LarE [Spirochaetes bacterium]|nr:ATP-dependent sacrificial sulfur transferase LarE [Spirochaetota bacterium]